MDPITKCALCCGDVAKTDVSPTILERCFPRFQARPGNTSLLELQSLFANNHRTCDVELKEYKTLTRCLELTLRAFSSTAMSAFFEIAYLRYDYQQLYIVIWHSLKTFARNILRRAPIDQEFALTMDTLVHQVHEKVERVSKFTQIRGYMQSLMQRNLPPVAADKQPDVVGSAEYVLKHAMLHYLSIYCSRRYNPCLTNEDAASMPGFPTTIPTMDPIQLKWMRDLRSTSSNASTTVDLQKAAHELVSVSKTFVTATQYISMLSAHYARCKDICAHGLANFDAIVGRFCDSAKEMLTSGNHPLLIVVGLDGAPDYYWKPQQFLQYVSDKTDAMIQSTRARSNWSCAPALKSPAVKWLLTYGWQHEDEDEDMFPSTDESTNETVKRDV